MGIRMTAALAACLVVNSLWRDGIDAGFGWYLVVAYLITLAWTFFTSRPAEDANERCTCRAFGPFGNPRGASSTHGERHG